jgi:hypothetical protein
MTRQALALAMSLEGGEFVSLNCSDLVARFLKDNHSTPFSKETPNIFSFLGMAVELREDGCGFPLGMHLRTSKKL